MKKLLMAGAAAIAALGAAHANDDISAITGMIAEVNAELENAGANYRAEYGHVHFVADSGVESQLVLFNNRGNKQLLAQFMENDTRRAWSGGDPNTIDWTVNSFFTTSDMSLSDQLDAAFTSVQTWADVQCSDPGLNGAVVNLPTGPAIGGALTADLMFSGFLPGSSFGNPNILGVHFGFVFIDENGEPTDLNNDGFSDKAFGDIYFNDAYTWSVDTPTPAGAIDYISVATHEFGHGLNQEHFGKGFIKKKGGLQFAPRAVMNAGYTGPFRDLAGTDNGGHCSMWASWPNN